MDIHQHIDERELQEVINAVKQVKEIISETEAWNNPTSSRAAIQKIKDIVGTYQFETIIQKLNKIQWKVKAE